MRKSYHRAEWNGGETRCALLWRDAEGYYDVTVVDITIPTPQSGRKAFLPYLFSIFCLLFLYLYFVSYKIVVQTIFWMQSRVLYEALIMQLN